jgi:uncharacterized protein (TIGR02145 family)
MNWNKSIVGTLFLWVLFRTGLGVLCQAVPPDGINYQAIAVNLAGEVLVGRDSEGRVLSGTEIGVRFGIIDEQGALMYKEEHKVQTDAMGLFSLRIGAGRYAEGKVMRLEELDWTKGFRLRVEWDTEGQGHYRVVGEQPLWSVPYAKYSDASGDGKGVYELWLSEGYEGSVTDFLEFLKGESGGKGPEGDQGPRGERGLEGTVSPGKVEGAFPYWSGEDWVLDQSGVRMEGSQMVLGEGVLESSALMRLESKQSGFLPVVMSIEQRDAMAAPVDGLMIFNRTTGCPNYYYAGEWYEWCGVQGKPSGQVLTLDCEGALNIGEIRVGDEVLGPFGLVSYTGGNGGIYSERRAASLGVEGLEAWIEGGTMTIGEGSLRVEIGGRAEREGLAIFVMEWGGKDCILSWEVGAMEDPEFPFETVHCDPDNITRVIQVVNPLTGRVWMDRNLGATRVAQAADDAASFGDLYQWGRFGDGHQCRNSGSTLEQSSVDRPGHGDYILVGEIPFDWRNPQNPDLWQGREGLNNPCPQGYRVPSDTEFAQEMSTWAEGNTAGAFASSLRLPSGGIRHGSLNVIQEAGTEGTYWTSTSGSVNSNYVYLWPGFAHLNNGGRSSGRSLRCIRHEYSGEIEALDCNAEESIQPVSLGQWVEGLTLSVPYEGGNGGDYPERLLASTGVTGWVAKLSSGNFNTGAGLLEFDLQGSAVEQGEAVFTLVIGGQICTFSLEILPEPAYPLGTQHCDPDNPTSVIEVMNPLSGRIWMDRNLGATRVAQAADDAASFGDLYQWGRFGDGHQCRNSNLLFELSSLDQPGHGDFIPSPEAPGDWRAPANDDLWQTLSALNNPCPMGFRVPSAGEWEVESATWNSNDRPGAFASTLKLPAGGMRIVSGILLLEGERGNYWSSSTMGTGAINQFMSEFGGGTGSNERANGFSLRCIKE